MDRVAAFLVAVVIVAFGYYRQRGCWLDFLRIAEMSWSFCQHSLQTYCKMYQRSFSSCSIARLASSASTMANISATRAARRWRR
jgi:hypothetical protein